MTLLSELGALALEVLEEHVQALRVLTEVADDNARAADDLPGVALTVNLAETGPGTEGLGVRHLEEVDVVLVACLLYTSDAADE